MGNTFFKHRSYHKCMRVARGQYGVEMKSIIDLVLLKRDMLRYVQDVMVVRGMGLGLSDPYVVPFKIRLIGAWIKRRDIGIGVLEARN